LSSINNDLVKPAVLSPISSTTSHHSMASFIFAWKYRMFSRSSVTVTSNGADIHFYMQVNYDSLFRESAKACISVMYLG
jgi:hypothetical protein